MTPLDLLTIFLPDMLGTVVGIVAGLYLHRLHEKQKNFEAGHLVLAVIESTVSANIAATERVLAIYKEGGHLAVVGGLRTIVWQVLQHELAPLPHTVLKVRIAEHFEDVRTLLQIHHRHYELLVAPLVNSTEHLREELREGLLHNGADLIETSTQLLREIGTIRRDAGRSR